MTIEEIKKFIEDCEFENETIIFTSPAYESAFIGLTVEGIAVYSYPRMIKYLIDKKNMDDLDAMDFIEYNTVNDLSDLDNTPIIIYEIEEYKI